MKNNISATLPLNQDSEIPLYRQIYRNLRRAIMLGQILPGTKMPSTRTLSKQLNVSRNTVINAYEQLIAEGCLVSEHGSGTYVAFNLESTNLTPSSESIHKPERNGNSNRADRMLKMLHRTIKPMPACKDGKIRAFREGVPALDMFPYKTWQRLINKAWRFSPSELLCGGSYLPLCEAIAAYLNVARGVSCSTEQVIVVSGSQMGISLVGQVLLDPGEAVWIEDPGYPGAYGAFQSVSVTTIPVPVDKEGLLLQEGIRKCPNARLAFVTPSHQFPLGSMMSFRRRLELLNWAEQNNSWILEDDYDSEFRYSGRPITALQAIDMKRRVIYLGTFSKVMFPAIRLGYLVVPLDLVEAFRAARQFTIQYPPLLEQAALADFINLGHFNHHIHRMRALYESRQNILIKAAKNEWEGIIETESSDAGMHLIGWLPGSMDDQDASKKVARCGIDAFPLSNFCFDEKLRGAFVLGFAGINENDIRAGVSAIRQALVVSRKYNRSVQTLPAV